MHRSRLLLSASTEKGPKWAGIADDNLTAWYTIEQCNECIVDPHSRGRLN